jgi:hypothetical protein
MSDKTDPAVKTLPAPVRALKKFIEHHAPAVKELNPLVSNVVTTTNERRAADKGTLTIVAKDAQGFASLTAILDGKQGAAIVDGVEVRVQLAAQPEAKAPRAEFRFVLTYPKSAPGKADSGN